jgi:hypothetical protein
VAAVDAVEVADGQGAPPAPGGRRLVPAQAVNRHGAFPLPDVPGLSCESGASLSSRQPVTVLRNMPEYLSGIIHSWLAGRLDGRCPAELGAARAGSIAAGERKVRAPQDAVMGNTHRPSSATKRSEG